MGPRISRTFGEVNVEAKKVEVLNGLKLDGVTEGVTEEVLVDKGLDCWVCEKLLIVGDEAVVNVVEVVEMESSGVGARRAQ